MPARRSTFRPRSHFGEGGSAKAGGWGEGEGASKGLHSIRINDQWRVVFLWEGENAFNVQIVDYH
ncbi:MAG: type II toxin-antitoxin system RelE/ParE family toxin [Nitrospinae bacterium]|nr:type II toxin-antitoxin system RelE/ParE family toxin [Nitrospinota bacterium]